MAELGEGFCDRRGERLQGVLQLGGGRQVDPRENHPLGQSRDRLICLGLNPRNLDRDASLLCNAVQRCGNPRLVRQHGGRHVNAGGQLSQQLLKVASHDSEKLVQKFFS